MQSLAAFQRFLQRRSRLAIVALAACGVAIVGWADYLTGLEVSMSLFYLAPVGLAAWYAGRGAGIAIAALSCGSWYLMAVAAGAEYSHPAIPVWNAFVRLGFFLVTGLLLSELRSSLRTQQELARLDGLTGLFNRRVFVERLEHDLALAQRRGSVMSLAYLDLDGFKTINDRHGHVEGDRVLRLIGQALRESVREVDTAARLGGDEFALLLPDTDEPGARQVMAKLTSEFARATAATHCALACSIGVVTFLAAPASAERAMAAADEVMYGVKKQGKGSVAFRVVTTARPGNESADARDSVAAG